MINIDDIAAANAFVRQARRGVPPDRWASTEQLHKVAAGIAAYHLLTQTLTDVVEQLRDQLAAQGEASMAIHTEDSKYAEK